MTHYGENVFFLSPEYRIGLGFFQNAANSLEIRFFFLIVIRAESDIILSPLSRLSVRISKKLETRSFKSCISVKINIFRFPN